MLKKFTQRFLLRKAGRAQLVGIAAAVVGAMAVGRANPELMVVINDGGPGLIAGIVAFVVAIIAAVDADKVAAPIIEENKK